MGRAGDRSPVAIDRGGASGGPGAIPARARRVRAGERGMTLLEGLLAGVLVAMAAATFSQTVSSVTGSNGRQATLLSTAELANRLILMYVDNADDMPRQSAPIEYDGKLYRWRLDDSSPVGVYPSDAGAAASADSRAASRLSQRIKLVRIDVWLGEDSGGSVTFADALEDATPLFTLTRLVDTLDFDNYDAATRMGPEAMMGRLLELTADDPLAEESDGGRSGSGGPDRGGGGSEAESGVLDRILERE